MRKKAKIIALGGITTAITFALCWLGSVSAGQKFLMPGICGIFLMVIMRTVSGKTAVATYVTSSILLLLLPNKITTFSYILLLGYYPILCEWLTKRSVLLRILIKLLVVTAAGCTAFFAGVALLNLWDNSKFIEYYPYLILVYYVISLIYDVFLNLLRQRFRTGWDSRIKKLLGPIRK